jgi:hypothetical protein
MQEITAGIDKVYNVIIYEATCQLRNRGFSPGELKLPVPL